MIFDVCDKFESDLKTTDIKAIIHELVLYVQDHFRDEERLMAGSGYPQIENHIELHKKMMVEVHTFAEKYHENNLSDILRVRSYVQHWLSDHILNEDLKFAKFYKDKMKSKDK